MASLTQRIRSLIALAILALLVPVLAACGATGGGAPAEGGAVTAVPAEGGAAEKPFKIGVSNGFVGSEWRTQMIQNLQDVNAEYKSAGLTEDLIIESADVDVPGQIQQIRNLINKGVNAIIINPNDQKALNPVIKEAKDAGIIVIAVDQEVDSPDVINVVIDQTEWARISAKWLVEQLDGQGSVVVINGIAGHPANEARYNGVKEIFEANPGINVLNVVNANWDQTTGQQKMSELLASQPNIDGVWTQDGMASGVLRAVQSANPQKWPVMVGEARVEYLRLWDEVRKTNPDFTAFGVVNPPGVGASGLRIAVELLQGRELKEPLAGPFTNSIYVPIPGEVTQDNFEEELAKHQDKPQSYTLDGILSADEAKGLFK
jgi:ribose transport system substrate-binding protein